MFGVFLKKSLCWVSMWPVYKRLGKNKISYRFFSKETPSGAESLKNRLSHVPHLWSYQRPRPLCLYQLQALFRRVGCSHQVAKVLELPKSKVKARRI